jgi:hypothetical protein
LSLDLDSKTVRLGDDPMHRIHAFQTMWIRWVAVASCLLVMDCGGIANSSSASAEGGRAASSGGKSSGGDSFGGSEPDRGGSGLGGGPVGTAIAGTATGGTVAGTIASGIMTGGVVTGGTPTGGTIATGGTVPGGTASGGTIATGGMATGGSATGGTIVTDTAFTGAGANNPATGGNADDCRYPYSPPIGGPRADGPENIASPCKDISDAALLERYDNEAVERVPSGLYYEQPSSPPNTWEAPCSDSQAVTFARFTQAKLGVPEVQSSTDWFYEVSYCDAGFRYVYRNLRCSYFDGSRLTGGATGLPFLVSLLFWSANARIGGRAILGYNMTAADGTDTLELCTMRTGNGLSEECGEVYLESTIYLIAGDGTVQVGTPTKLRTLPGRCWTS